MRAVVLAWARITTVRLSTESGAIAVTRPDGRGATLSGEPDRQVVLRRRGEAELIAEELRRLEPDDVYREAVRGDRRASSSAIP
ncbi:hypothetical protein GCM10029978_075700 [Actinoallomurus acanthiterrae]